MPSNITLEELYLLEHYALVTSAGVLAGALIAGGLIVLAILCLFLLSSDTKGSRKQRIILQTYVIVLIPVVLGLQVMYLLGAHPVALLHPHSPEEEKEKSFRTVRWPFDLLPVVVTGMTDGLFIWRCYMVQRSLKRTSTPWQHIFWVLPACLWVLSLVAGIVSTVSDNSIVNLFPLVSALQSTMFISNAIINLYATIFISLRLLLHQRAMVAGLGKKALPARYSYIISVLLQSAAINVPIAITTAVGIWLETSLSNSMIPVAGASQALASVLVIHQVARARRAGSQKVEAIQILVRSGTSSNSEAEKPEPAV